VELAKEQEQQEDLAPRQLEQAIDTSQMTQVQIRQMGMEALQKAIGLAGTKQFIQSFDPEGGDFIRSMTMAEIFARTGLKLRLLRLFGREIYLERQRGAKIAQPDITAAPRLHLPESYLYRVSARSHLQSETPVISPTDLPQCS